MIFFGRSGAGSGKITVDGVPMTDGASGSAQVADLTIITRPNCSLSETGRLLFFCVMLLLSVAIAVGFALIGAWLIFPFAGLEMAGLGWALYYISCHTGDYECIVVSGDRVLVETRSYKSVEKVEFQRHWVKVIVQPPLGHGRCRIWVRASGKEVELGRFVDDDGRMALSRQIEEQTGMGYKL